MEGVREKLSGIGDFEETMGPTLRGLSKTIEKLARLKKIGKQPETMNLVELRKQLDETRRMTAEISETVSGLEQELQSFSIAPSATEQTEWWERFRRAFHAGYPPVEGEFPVFQVFPIEVRVDLEHELVLINNRTVRTLHPYAVAASVEKEVDRLNRERFNAVPFARALLRAYDLLMAEARDKAHGRSAGSAVPLKEVHKILSLRSGASGYSLNQFAFDIYRLRRSESLTTDGRRMEFGSSRNRGIVITLPGGQQENLGSLEVFEAKADD